MIMKKIILVILILAALSLGCNGQSDTTTSIISFAHPSWNVGIKAGVNITSAYSAAEEVFDTEPRAGFVGGVFAEIPLGKYMLLQPEVLLSQRRLQVSGILNANAYTVTRQATYLDVPVLAAFKPARFIKLLAGPQYSYLLKQRDSFSANVSQSLQEEFKGDAFRNHTLCVTFGAEFTIQHFVICSRLGWDLLSNRQNHADITPEYRMIWYRFMVGYKFF
jgi:hypothetical protein